MKKNELYKIEVFGNRMKKLGIKIQCGANYPWIYLDYVNDKRVTERFMAEHGFTLGFLPVNPDKEFYFTDIGEIFKIIRKYCNNE